MSVKKEEECLVGNLGRIQLEKLRLNCRKSHWESCSIPWLLRRLQEEVGELFEALLLEGDPYEIEQECADIANFAAMIAQNKRCRG